MDVKNLTDTDLATFLEMFRQCAVVASNRFFLDLFVVIERESIRRHEATELHAYSDTELLTALTTLKEVVDQLRGQGVPDSYPGLRFVLLAMTEAITEMERRQGAPLITH